MARKKIEEEVVSTEPVTETEFEEAMNAPEDIPVITEVEEVKSKKKIRKLVETICGPRVIEVEE